LFVSELRPQIEPRRVSQIQKSRFNGCHGGSVRPHKYYKM
jgi:hypothetical protein